jgi:hypothetical protein
VVAVEEDQVERAVEGGQRGRQRLTELAFA